MFYYDVYGYLETYEERIRTTCTANLLKDNEFSATASELLKSPRLYCRGLV